MLPALRSISRTGSLLPISKSTVARTHVTRFSNTTVKRGRRNDPIRKRFLYGLGFVSDESILRIHAAAPRLTSSPSAPERESGTIWGGKIFFRFRNRSDADDDWGAFSLTPSDLGHFLYDKPTATALEYQNKSMTLEPTGENGGALKITYFEKADNDEEEDKDKTVVINLEEHQYLSLRETCKYLLPHVAGFDLLFGVESKIT